MRVIIDMLLLIVLMITSKFRLGAAWWISQRLVKTVFDHEDNLERCSYDISNAWKLIKNHFKIDQRVDMLEHCYAKFNKSFYAKLCQKMSVAALDGDELCKSIFVDAGRVLAKMILALLPKISSELVKTGYLSIICVGSVWISWNLLKGGFIKELERHKIPFELRLLRLRSGISMAIGSIYMAADSVKYPLPRDYEENYEIFFNFGGNCEHINNNIL
jgi:N-acetylglucosamine kinase